MDEATYSEVDNLGLLGLEFLSYIGRLVIKFFILFLLLALLLRGAVC